MEKTTWTQAEAQASKVIGKHRLFGTRGGPEGKRVRMFVAYGKDDIEEVTAIVARVCEKKLDKEGRIIAGAYGYCPVMGLSEAYARWMGEQADEHPYRAL